MAKYVKQIVLTLLIPSFSIVVAAPTTWAGETYHVSTSGKDNGPGTKQDPWKTLEYAASMVGPGDTVLISKGTYKPFRIRQGGKHSAEVTFKADGGASGKVVIKGKEKYGIAVWRTAYVVVEGVVIIGSQQSIGFFVNESDHVTLRNSRVSGTDRPCVHYRHSDFGTIDRSRIHDCGQRGPNGEGVYLGSVSGNRSRGHIVRNSTIYNTKDEAIDLKPGSQDALIEKNNIYNIQLRDGGAIHVRGSGHIIRDNKISNVAKRSDIKKNKLMPAIASDTSKVKMYNNSMTQTAGCRGSGCEQP